MELYNLKPKRGATKNRKRIARGEGSRGGTSTRGNKGAQARTGYQAKRGFEGGQMPLHKRIPKFGFKNIKAKKLQARLIFSTFPSLLCPATEDFIKDKKNKGDCRQQA